MSKFAFLGLAAIFIAAGNAAKAYAEGAEDASPAPAENGGDTEPAKRRGRPPGSTTAAKTEPAQPAEKTAEERLAANRVLIEPYTKANRGEEVKAIIKKYSPTGLKDLPADKQGEFEKDLAALDY